VFENRVLRRIFRQTRDEITGGRRKPHNEESMRMRFTEHVARMSEKRHAYRLVAGKGNNPLGRPTYRWVDSIKMDLGEIGWGCFDWIGLAQDRDKRRALVNAVMNRVAQLYPRLPLTRLLRLVGLRW
jgi:hypothetical protein